jgi:hypothetical protein
MAIVIVPRVGSASSKYNRKKRKETDEFKKTNLKSGEVTKGGKWKSLTPKQISDRAKKVGGKQANIELAKANRQSGRVTRAAQKRVKKQR